MNRQAYLGRPIPQRGGIFWGRGQRVGYYDMIVYICGEHPFLKIDIWHIFERRLQKDASPNAVVEFGPEIDDLSQFPPDEAWKLAYDDWRTENVIE